MRKLAFLLFVVPAQFLLPQASFGQDLTGIWRGYFITDDGDQYKLEFQLDLKPSSMASGVSYSYLDTRFYGKALMTGHFEKKNKVFTIQELRTVEVRSLGGGGTCIMNYRFTYARSGKEEFLEGTYIGRNEDRSNPANNGTWGDCGKGTVFLRRVVASDFYVEPFLKNKLQPKDTPVKAKVSTPPPAVKKPVMPSRPVAAKKPAPAGKPAATLAKKPSTPARPLNPEKPAAPVVTERRTEPVVTEKPVVRQPISIPAVTRERRNELTQAVTVSNEDIVVRLYDNGTIDDDTISVYLDGQLILSNKRLSAEPITLRLKMSEENPEHTLVMVAENLGRIPPNTSLMVVQDGDKRHQVSITSTEQKNAMVRFRYQKPG